MLSFFGALPYSAARSLSRYHKSLFPLCIAVSVSTPPSAIPEAPSLIIDSAMISSSTWDPLDRIQSGLLHCRDAHFANDQLLKVLCPHMQTAVQLYSLFQRLTPQFLLSLLMEQGAPRRARLVGRPHQVGQALVSLAHGHDGRVSSAPAHLDVDALLEELDERRVRLLAHEIARDLEIFTELVHVEIP